MSLYRIHLLPAAHGDCILIEYGTPKRPNRVLIDGGTEGTWKRLEAVLGELPEKERTLDLLVITHVDADHIGGALSLFDGGLTGLQFGDIWFNGYRHLSGLEEQGPVQGEKLTTRLWSRRERWNKAFGGKAVVVPLVGKLPAKTLPGGMKLTLLSPTSQRLQKLKPVWERECKRAGLDPQTVPPSPPEGLEAMGSLAGC